MKSEGISTMRLTNPITSEIWDSALEKRPKLWASFPFVVTIGCYYPDMDKCVHWCWITFGPKNGKCDECDSTSPACPFVLAKSILQYTDDPEDAPEWNRTGTVEVHEHQGTWTTLWLGKTGNDYGNIDFCFSTEQQKELFLRYLEFC